MKRRSFLAMIPGAAVAGMAAGQRIKHAAAPAPEPVRGVVPRLDDLVRYTEVVTGQQATGRVSWIDDWIEGGRRSFSFRFQPDDKLIEYIELKLHGAPDNGKWMVTGIAYTDADARLCFPSEGHIEILARRSRIASRPRRVTMTHEMLGDDTTISDYISKKVNRS